VKWIWLAATGLLLAGCGVQPSDVTDSGTPPTGMAPGVTLYFVDGAGQLRPELRRTGRLGSIAEAVSLLLAGTGGSDLRTEIAPTTVTQVDVTTTPSLIELRVPLTADDVTPLGIDQIVCTALGVDVQGGGARTTKVRIGFTLPSPESDQQRTCPLIR
jgi:hypothetical protein